MRLTLILIAACLFGQQTADPITDRMRYEIAAAQRDYLLAQRQLEQAAQQLKAKAAAAEKACTDAGKTFSVEGLVCTEKESK